MCLKRTNASYRRSLIYKYLSGLAPSFSDKAMKHKARSKRKYRLNSAARVTMDALIHAALPIAAGVLVIPGCPVTSQAGSCHADRENVATSLGGTPKLPPDSSRLRGQLQRAGRFGG